MYICIHIYNIYIYICIYKKTTAVLCQYERITTILLPSQSISGCVLSYNDFTYRLRAELFLMSTLLVAVINIFKFQYA